ncbi:SDR family oxidoreductase [Desulfovibrio caledoniensis]
MSVRFLVIGGDSTLGGGVQARLEADGHEVAATSRRAGSALPLDLAGDVTEWTPPEGLHTAFLFAAACSIEECERAPGATRRINVDNTVLLARRLLDAGCRVVFPSSSLVFDGTVPLPAESTPRSPVTEYGRQKGEAEVALLGLGEGVSVIRYTKVVTFPMPLLAGWGRQLAAGETVRPFEDMYFAPVPLDFAVNATVRAAYCPGGGIWHVSAETEMSYADAVRLIARDAGADENLIKGCTVASTGRNLPAPRYAALSIARLRRGLGLQPPSLASTVLVAAR